MFAEIIDPDKLASQGSTYVLAVMVLVMLYALRMIATTYRSDMRESQEKFLTALDSLKLSNTQLATQVTKESSEIKELVRDCRMRGRFDEVILEGDSGTRLGRRPLPVQGG